MNLVRFFRCVAQAVLHRGPRALAGLVPFGEQLWDIAADACQRLHEKPEAEVRAEVEAIAQADAAQVQQAVAATVAEVADGQSPAVQRTLAAYLAQVPAAIRQSNKRPADPSGKTVAEDRSFKDPRQVLALLPPRWAAACPPAPSAARLRRRSWLGRSTLSRLRELFRRRGRGQQNRQLRFPSWLQNQQRFLRLRLPSRPPKKTIGSGTCAWLHR